MKTVDKELGIETPKPQLNSEVFQPVVLKEKMLL